jgi:hypothetical protein
MIREIPLILSEAIVTSRFRLLLQEPLAKQLAAKPNKVPIMMDEWGSSALGALEEAGVPLINVFGRRDGAPWL